MSALKAAGPSLKASVASLYRSFLREARRKDPSGARGTVDDIKPGSSVLPIVRVQGGVYFINRTYGCSLVADAVLVIKDHCSASRSSDDTDVIPRVGGHLS